MKDTHIKKMDTDEILVGGGGGGDEGGEFTCKALHEHESAQTIPNCACMYVYMRAYMNICMDL